jgi:FkbM family methyltransferase
MEDDKFLELSNGIKVHINQQPQKYFHDLLNDKFYDEIVFLQKNKGYYVEIGALDGWQQSQSIHFEHVKEWDGIIVEPVMDWFEQIKKHRACHICTNPISDVRETNKFVVRDFLAYSHMVDVDEIYGPDKVKSVIEVDTITLYDLFEKYKSPTLIDFVSIDTEGYEYRIMNKYFEENDKYKINLISFETNKQAKMHEIMISNSYIKIRNPYLDFIKVDTSKLGTVRMGSDNNFYNLANIMFDGTINELSDITWEHYYIHSDYLKDNPHLQKFIISTNYI